MRFTICDTIAARCRAQPERIAAQDIYGGNDISYGDVWRRIEGLSAAIRDAKAGRHGPVVGMLLPNEIDAPLLYAACQHAGVIALTLNGRLADKELASILTDADCRLVVSGGELADKARGVCGSLDIPVLDAADIATPEHFEAPVFGSADRGSDPCVIAYSSGTTGMPKGAVYSNDYFTMNNYRWGWAFGMTPDHTVLIAGPMFHLSYGGFALAALMIGAPLRIMREFSAETAFDELRDHSTFAFLVPSMLTMLHEEWIERDRAPLGAARHIISAGAPLPVGLAREAMAMFPQANIAEMYGSTETGFVTYEVKGPDTLLAHSVGWPAVGADVELFRDDGEPCDAGEAGEIGSRSGVPFPGYLGQPELTAESMHGDYLMSGDIGIRQEDGRICIVDRKKDMIITGGENVYTAEVERVLLEHADVAEAAVAGIPDERWGERVCALLVLNGRAVPDADAMEQHCRASLAGYKVPREIRFVDEIPRNAMGKIQKYRIVAMLTEDEKE